MKQQTDRQELQLSKANLKKKLTGRQRNKIHTIENKNKNMRNTGYYFLQRSSLQNIMFIAIKEIFQKLTCPLRYDQPLLNFTFE